MRKKRIEEVLASLKDSPSKGPVKAAIEGIKAIAPGLSITKILAEVGGELNRLGVQGSAELASAIFGNGPYVPYGRGQNPLDKGKEGMQGKEEQKPEQKIEEQNRSGREM